MSAGSSTSSGPSERFSVRVGGLVVAGVLHLPSSRPAPCVVACHGLGASKDSDKYLLLGRMMPEAGFALARFDFRGAGESGGSYRDATIATRVADLEAVLDHLMAHPALSGGGGLLGSSLGGFVALHVAHRRRAGDAPVVVTWNAPAVLRDLEEREMSEATGLGPALVAEIRAGEHAEAPAGVRCWLIRFTAVWITVSVLSPRKSNLMRPTFSTSFIANWVTISSFWPRKHGTYVHSGSSAITMPAACMPALRFKPSSDAARSSSSRCSGHSV